MTRVRRLHILAFLALAITCLLGLASRDAQLVLAQAPGGATATNLSQGRPATASSTDSSSRPAASAVDGNSTTRWSSAYSDPQWLQVDLGAVYSISQVKLNWEAAYARAYQIQVSNDRSAWTTVYSTTTSTGGNQTLSVSGTGRYVRLYGTKRATQWGYSLWEFQVFGAASGTSAPAPTNTPAPTASPASTASPAPTTPPVPTVPPAAANVALNRAATASSTDSSSRSAASAVDGSTTTRWSSAYSDPQWLQVDLGTSYAIDKVVLNWEAAYGRAYQIQVSGDGAAWTTIYSTTTGTGGNETLNVNGAGRYIRLYATQRATQWGYSLWEFQVFGTVSGGTPATPTPTSSPVPTSSPAPTATPVPTATLPPTVIPAQGAPVTFAPPSIAASDGEIVGNSGRGAYRWYDNSPDPSGWPAADGYMRWSWRDIEPTEGNYQWALIDSKLAAAAARGGTFGLRIMPANSWAGGNSIPDYLMARMPLGFWFNSPDNGKSMYAPDWNDPDYMARAEALIRAVAARYANDPRLGWVEMGPYGDYGEWHVWRWPYPSPTGAQDMTLANRQKLIDLHTQLFPATKLVQMIDSATGNNQTMAYALSRSPEIGIRSDCFGTSLFDTRVGEVAAAGYGDRWKTAPMIIEYCGGGAGSGQQATGKRQVSSGHVSLVEGNHGSYSGYSAQEKADFDATRKLAGYRLRLSSVTLPSYLTAGTSFGISAQWANEGVAPVYRDWEVLLQLRDPVSGTLGWNGISTLKLRTLLPTGSSPLSIADSFSLPADTPKGTYNLELVVQDPGGYLKPLALAMQGRKADGAYSLGQVTVR